MFQCFLFDLKWLKINLAQSDSIRGVNLIQSQSIRINSNSVDENRIFILNQTEIYIVRIEAE